MRDKDVEITRATISDVPTIWKLQRLAFQAQGKLYNNWQLPPLVETLCQMEEDFSN